MESMNERHAGASAGCVGSAFLLIVMLLVGAALNGCSRPRVAEPGLVAPLATAEPGQQAAAATIPALSTAAPTLTPPPLPSPLPTAEPVQQSAAAALEATQTAAAHPPTPEIVAPPPDEPTISDDIFATAEPMPTPFGVYSWTLKVPILMYHYISHPPPDADIYRVDLSVTPEMFRQQMVWLRENGYETIDLYDLSGAIVNRAELPEKPVLLTFDDGYLDNYENAYPILQELGFEGTFFIVTDFVDSGREGYMTWPMIEEMARAGHRIESHSRTHPDLRGLSHDVLVWQILGAQETLAAHIGYRPRYFCYPGGTYDAATIQILQELDYWGAVTTANGSWHGFDERYEWPRIRVRNSTTMNEFARLLDLEGTVRGKPPG